MLNKLASFLKNADRVVLIGMGNELRADDAVGLYLVRQLKPYSNKHLMVFKGHMTPEVFVSPACAFKPTHLLIIDAAELHKKPGSWQILTKEEIKEGLFTTHSIPAVEVAAEIKRRCSSQVAFLGIQPKTRDISLSLSKECSHAADEIIQAFKQILHLRL